MGLLNFGVLGMTVALLIAGYEQSFIERAVEGSTWGGYFAAQNHPWFQQAMHWRLLFGLDLRWRHPAGLGPPHHWQRRDAQGAGDRGVLHQLLNHIHRQ